VFLAPDFAYYRAASSEVMAIVRRHVEVVEVVGLDEVYLELTGLPAPHACMRRVRAETERATGLGCSVGIGPNKLIAKVASDAEKPRGFVVLSREQACARFAGASPGLIPGIGPKSVERLRALGITTIAALASADRSQLAAGIGHRGAAHLQSLARFDHDGAVTQERKVVSESRERTFDQDIDDREQLELILERLVRELCAALEGQRRRGRTIGIKVRLADFSTYTRARTLSEPVSAAARVGPVALDLLRSSPPARPVRLLGVRVAGLEHDEREDQQLTLAV
jgi:DNA polymerase-4